MPNEGMQEAVEELLQCIVERTTAKAATAVGWLAWGFVLRSMSRFADTPTQIFECHRYSLKTKTERKQRTDDALFQGEVKLLHDHQRFCFWKPEGTLETGPSNINFSSGHQPPDPLSLKPPLFD